MEPSLKNCSTQWNIFQKQPQWEVFRNQSVISTVIIPKNVLESLQFKFSSEMDPVTKAPIELAFDLNNFSALDNDEDTQQALFKYAALNLINSAENAEFRASLSVKYQTLCDETALVGVIK